MFNLVNTARCGGEGQAFPLRVDAAAPFLHDIYTSGHSVLGTAWLYI